MAINLRNQYHHDSKPDTLTQKFTDILNEPSNPFNIQISDNLIILKIKKENYHWYSPEMNMRFEDDEDGQTAIFEVIGPNPSMFTQAMFFALLGSVTFLFAVIIGFSQISLGISPTLAFTVTSISALLVAIAFIVLAIGRMKAADQVNGLKKFVKRILTS